MVNTANLSTAATTANLSSISNNPLPEKMLQGSISCQEFHLKHHHYATNLTHSSHQAGFHFHLAGFIDPDAGIPSHLLPNIKSKDVNFIVHWMNNKDFHFTYAAELFSKEIYERLRKIRLNKTKHFQAQHTESDESTDVQDGNIFDSLICFVFYFRENLNSLFIF